MAQIILGGKDLLNLGADLDPMFTELFGFYGLFTIAGANLGLGGAPGTDKFAVAGAGSANLLTTRSTDVSGARVGLQAVGSTSGYAGTFSAHPFILVSNGGAERMHINASGVGVNTTPTAGLHVNKDASSYIAKFERPSVASRLAFYTAVNNFNIDAEGASNQLNFATNGVVRIALTPTGPVQPGADNTQTLGAASFRWSTVYAGTGTINTSDAREKTTVRPLSAPELAAATALAKEIGSFQFLASVESKGGAAREHIGMTVQRAVEIMEQHGLEPMRYGFICYDEWEEVRTPARVEQRSEETGLLDLGGQPILRSFEVEVEPEKVIPAGNRFSFRPDELLMFIARGFEARLSALEGH